MSAKTVAQALLDANGFVLAKDAPTNKITVKADAHGALNLWRNVDYLTTSAGVNPENARQFTDYMRSDDDAHFLGSTVAETERACNGEFETKTFRDAQEKIKGLIKVQELETLSAKKRSRVFSEYDGEVDFDRQWELKPFANTRAETGGVQRTLEINVDFSFNCSVTAKSIARYGAIAWAIADLVERAGIQVTINAVATVNNLIIEDRATLTSIINVKRAGDYTDVLALARCFTPWFYRRITWSTWVTVAEARGETASRNLGNPQSQRSGATLGVLNIGTEAVDGYDADLTRLAKFLRQAVGLETID